MLADCFRDKWLLLVGCLWALGGCDKPLPKKPAHRTEVVSPRGEPSATPVAKEEPEQLPPTFAKVEGVSDAKHAEMFLEMCNRHLPRGVNTMHGLCRLTKVSTHDRACGHIIFPREQLQLFWNPTSSQWSLRHLVGESNSESANVRLRWVDESTEELKFELTYEAQDGLCKAFMSYVPNEGNVHLSGPCVAGIFEQTDRAEQVVREDLLNHLWGEIFSGAEEATITNNDVIMGGHTSHFS